MGGPDTVNAQPRQTWLTRITGRPVLAIPGPMRKKVAAGGWDRSSSEFTFRTSLRFRLGSTGRVIVGPGRRDWAAAAGVGRRGGTSAVGDMDAEESPEVGESAGDGLDESAGLGPAVSRQRRRMISARLGGPVTADEPAGAGRLADPGGHLRGAGDPGADGAGLTLLEDDRANIIVATAAFVSETRRHHRTGSDMDRASLLLERVEQLCRAPWAATRGSGVRWHGRPAGCAQRAVVTVGHPRPGGRGDERVRP